MGLKGMLLGSQIGFGFGLAWGGPRGEASHPKLWGKLRPGDRVEVGSKLKSEDWPPQRKIEMSQLSGQKQGVQREWVVRDSGPGQPLCARRVHGRAGSKGQTLSGQIRNGAWHFLNPLEGRLLKWSNMRTKGLRF